MDHTINQLNPGQSLELSRCGDVWVTVERSGNGKTLRFVRHTPTSSTVFRSTKF